jgi:hypothetical protein
MNRLDSGLDHWPIEEKSFIMFRIVFIMDWKITQWFLKILKIFWPRSLIFQSIMKLFACGIVEWTEETGKT